jgi:thiosulfate/3-mercaptopyruvate sulfurtransferase
MNMTDSSSDRRYFLVDTDWVSSHLGDPDLRIFDCTILLTPTSEDPFKIETVHSVWHKGHLPNAGFIDLRDELSGPCKRSPLEFNLPSEEQFAQVMSQKEVNRSSFVVLYCAQHPMWATRVWWMLRAFGHDKVVVMDGGWDKWVAEGRPTSTEACYYPPTKFELSKTSSR